MKEFTPLLLIYDNLNSIGCRSNVRGSKVRKVLGCPVINLFYLGFRQYPSAPKRRRDPFGCIPKGRINSLFVRE